MEWERERSTALPPPSPPPPLALATRGSLLEVRNREREERREDSRDPAFRSKRKQMEGGERKDLSPFRLFDKGISKESYSAGCQPVCSLAPRLVLIKLFPRSPASPPPRGGSASEESTRKSWMTEGGGGGEIDR